jgi:hypothetical protein
MQKVGTPLQGRKPLHLLHSEELILFRLPHPIEERLIIFPLLSTI